MYRSAADRFLGAILDPRCDLNTQLFGFQTLAPDWQIQPRRVPEHLVYFVVSQGYVGWIGRRRRPLRLESGGLMWLPPGVEHSFHHRSGGRPMRLFHMRFTLHQQHQSLNAGSRPIIIRSATTLRPQFEQLYDEYHAALQHRCWRYRALLCQMLCDVFRLSRASQHDLGPTLSPAQRHRLLQRIGQKPRTWLQPVDLAQTLGLSHDYFTRLFKRTYGLPPRTWLMQERIRRAAARLDESHTSVSEVAHQFGYYDLFLFSRQFKQVMGLSPRGYRMRYTSM